MIKDSLLYRILIRYLKENNVFHIYKKYINDDYFNILDDTFYHYTSSLLTFFAFRNKDNTLEQLNINHNIFWKLNHIYNFNRIINELCIYDFIKFLEKKSLINNFAKNIIESKRYSLLLLENTDNKYIIINNYIHYFINNGFCIFDIFRKAFSWSSSKEGYEYWYEINSLFIKHMWIKLLINK